MSIDHLLPLSLKHKDLLGGRFKGMHVSLSEYSFANLFLFRHIHDHHILIKNDAVFISGKTYDGYRYLMSASDLTPGSLPVLQQLAQGYDFIFPLPERWLGLFDVSTSRYGYLEGDSDYVYTVERLATFKGQKLHTKKNLLNQFLSLYTPQAKPLTIDLMPDAQNILDAWQEDVGGAREDTDYAACREAFELYDELVLCGGIYYVDGEPAGFIIGEEISDDMFTLHFAKGKRKFKGMYQYMFNQFARILPSKYRFMNFEQDMGKLALRIAKASYHPDMILHKYRVYIKA